MKINSENKKNEDILMEKESPRVEKYLRYNFKNIEKVTFISLDETPMGGYLLEGYVNDNENINFTASIDNSFENIISYDSEFMYKKQESDGVGILKDIEDIEKEEKEK